ncbi:hypothetical protein ACIO02_34005 [Streptomyces sp. NPDC087568]|uniref:hypothetical protein n=1 Tax=unclassified Streptomyces TaxID=2593676 RepID=UPI0036E78877
MLTAILRRIARRCDVHDVPAQAKIRRLEQQLGITPSPATGDFVDQFADPDLIDCGRTWCTRQGPT